MNAWLITWESISPSINEENKIVAIFSSRRTRGVIADFIEILYLRTTSNAQEMAWFANRSSKIPYKADKVQIINNVPHGDRITCGHNPFLYARKVTNLKIANDPKKYIEILKWKEPPIFKWQDKLRLKIEIAHEGEEKELLRKASSFLSNELKSLNPPE